MEIRFLEIAEIEFIDAVDFYNQQSKGLGYEFAVEIKRTIDRIQRHAQAWAPLSKRTRRCRTNRFPYGIIYSVLPDDVILIVAVMHMNRHPDSWKTRMKSA